MSSSVSFASPLSFPISSSKTKHTYMKPHIIKAMSGDGRSNLDHLQRTTQVQQQQKPSPVPPKRRIAQPAPLGLWDRFPTARTLQQMMDTMDRVMEDPLVYTNTPSPSVSGQSPGYRRGRTPWEIKEGESEYKMRFDMPGMTKKDVKVWVEEKMLVFKAEKLSEKDKDSNESEGDEEWPAESFGRYNTRIALPENIVIDQIRAEVRDGVLYITIPKASVSTKVLDIDVQ